ncbi:MAG: hypothetical protein ACQGVK_08420 [Myxococcota bacterium]
MTKPIPEPSHWPTEVDGPDGWTYWENASPRFAFAVHPRDRAGFGRAWRRLGPDLAAHRPELVVLLPFRRAPTLDHPSRRRIHSFGVADLDARAIARLHGDAPRDEWAYRSCRDALGCGPSGRAARLLVRELPPARWSQRLRSALGVPGYRRLAEPRIDPAPDPAVMVVPHAGDLEPLEALLGLLEHARPPSLRVVVGFDEPVGAEHLALVEHFGRFGFWSIDPHGGGPYVFRAFVAERAPEPWVIFQDSDDVPCIDRLPALRGEARACDVLGSWELQVDERRGQLKVVRFPVEADAAIRRSGTTAQLHPTTIARTRALAEAGGLSTAHRFAADREIQLRMAFDHSLRNLDRVLYVRARREGSLSTAPGSAVRSDARAVLRERWDRAFRAVRDGGASLADGGLGPSHGDREIAFTELRSGRVERVRFGADPGDG